MKIIQELRGPFVLCTNWVESWKDVLKWENKIQFYDEFFLLFDKSTCDMSYSCSSSGAYVSAYGVAASFSCPVSYSCSSSGALKLKLKRFL